MTHYLRALTAKLRGDQTPPQPASPPAPSPGSAPASEPPKRNRQSIATPWELGEAMSCLWTKRTGSGSTTSAPTIRTSFSPSFDSHCWPSYQLHQSSLQHCSATRLTERWLACAAWPSRDSGHIALYELRNSQPHDATIRRLKDLEVRLGMVSCAEGTERGGLLNERPRVRQRLFGIMSMWHDRAIAMVYGASVSAWVWALGRWSRGSGTPLRFRLTGPQNSSNLAPTPAALLPVRS